MSNPDQAQREGGDAFAAGKPLSANPFSAMGRPSCYDAWNLGWLDARDAAGRNCVIRVDRDDLYVAEMPLATAVFVLQLGPIESVARALAVEGRFVLDDGGWLRAPAAPEPPLPGPLPGDDERPRRKVRGDGYMAAYGTTGAGRLY
jgi:hypothetical protein